MLLSIQQKYILSVLEKLRCLREDQLQRLVAAKFQHPDPETSGRRMSAMLRQLTTFLREVSRTAGYVSYEGTKPDPRKIEAVDVMIEFTRALPGDFHEQLEPPVLLRFSLAEENPRIFTVASFSLLKKTGGWPNRQRGERLIWIADDGMMPEELKLPSKQFFAARQADGTHRFYGSAES